MFQEEKQDGSCIYLFYYKKSKENEVPFYVGKTKNITERINDHISQSIIDSHTKLYNFILNELPNGWEDVKICILHYNLPIDSNDPIVCFFERYYYEHYSSLNYDMKNSVPPQLSKENIVETPTILKKRYKCVKSSLTDILVNQCLTQSVKINKFNNINYLTQKIKIIQKEKTIMNKKNNELIQQINIMKKENDDTKLRYEELQNSNISLNSNLQNMNDKNMELSEKIIDYLMIKNSQGLKKEFDGVDDICERNMNYNLRKKRKC